MAYTKTNWENLPSTNTPLNANNLNKIETQIGDITTGNATVNSTYVSNTEKNEYAKTGNIVSYGFTMTASGSWGSTTIFASGLPKSRYTTRFAGINHSKNSIMRFEITNTGELRNAYSTTAPSSGDTIEGHITYITTD